MGGFFGIVSKKECLGDVFFGVDYHSHLGTRRAGLAAYAPEIGLQRKIHNIENSPFRTKFEHVFEEMQGTSAIGCISDSEPQPLLIRSKLGAFAICTVGVVRNAEALIEQHVNREFGHYDAMTGGKVNSNELVASLICHKDNFGDGIKYAQEIVEGTVAILILRDDGTIIAARDKLGRLPMIIGRNEDGYCVTFESFAAMKLDFAIEKELGPGEVVELTAEKMNCLVPAGKKKKVCAFLWSYYGYPTSSYEGVNVEMMRYRNGALMAESDKEAGLAQDIDYVVGMSDSGTPHAIGYANASGKPFARAYIKYTPTWARSFTPNKQKERNRVAKMKQIPVPELIEGQKLLIVDDSIVRGTQIKETVDFLYENGAKEVHMRSACPPIMFGCKYHTFSRSTSEMDLIARQIIVELEGEEGFRYIDEYIDGKTERGKKLRFTLCKKFGFGSLEYQSLENTIKAIGLPECELCTYCWNGKE
ncbi:MAG: amidophosphoribosyltransferase [Clostridia bacterium]|nr:amidophosphoribosyltransferase [Clostridia bacterium]